MYKSGGGGTSVRVSARMAMHVYSILHLPWFDQCPVLVLVLVTSSTDFKRCGSNGRKQNVRQITVVTGPHKQPRLDRPTVIFTASTPSTAAASASAGDAAAVRPIATDDAGTARVSTGCVDAAVTTPVVVDAKAARVDRLPAFVACLGCEGRGGGGDGGSLGLVLVLVLVPARTLFGSDIFNRYSEEDAVRVGGREIDVGGDMGIPEATDRKLVDRSNEIRRDDGPRACT